SRDRVRAGGGMLSRLFGGGSREELTPQQRDPDSFGLRSPGRRGEAHARTVELIEDFSARHPELGVRTYRTRGGFRLLITGSGAAPSSARARELMGTVRSDELYMLLCRVHDTYRARLTPKPWRIAVDRFEELGTRTAADDVHRAWVRRYRDASADVAVCRLLSSTGPAPDPVERQVIGLRDRAVRPESGLRLARPAPPRAGGPRATENSACTTYDRARIGRRRGKPRPQRAPAGPAGPARNPVSAGARPQWATVAFSAPAPVKERTPISACLSSSCSGEVTEPSQ